MQTSRDRLPAKPVVFAGSVLRAARDAHLGVLMGLGVFFADPLSASAGTVSNAEDLAMTLKSAPPGTVIDLAGGDYGDLSLRSLSGAAGKPITIRSADAARPARFDQMTLRGVSHLVLEGVLFDYNFVPGQDLRQRPFQIIGGRDITVTRAVFDGDTARGLLARDNGHPTGFALTVRGTTGFRLENSEIRDFYRGIVVDNCKDVLIQNNDVHGIRMDGMNFAQVEDIRIENNQIHDFRRVVDSPDHADMIQFWTAGTDQPSRNITIRNNVLNSGGGTFTQSIFMRNEKVDRDQAGTEMFYRNVVIDGNVIINAHLHGITLGASDGVRIVNNTLIHNARSDGRVEDGISERNRANAGLWVPTIRIDPRSTGVQIRYNAAASISGYKGQPGWNVGDNFEIQDRFASRPGYYDKVFRSARSGDPRDLTNFLYRPDGPLGDGKTGAARLTSEDRLKTGTP